jgi:hypothetical protein
MRATVRDVLPKDLLEARSRFQAWRQRRQGRDRIPPSLWALAVRLVSTHGLSRTATALRLDYYSLKKHVESADQQPPSPSPAFVELPPPLLVSKQAVFELDNGTGATLRVQLSGYDAADLEVLARCFGNAR